MPTARSSGWSRPRAGTRCASCFEEIISDTAYDLGVDPGLQKDGVEKHLQELLADHPEKLREGLTLVRREFPTAIGPVDLLCRDGEGLSIAVEIKRRGEIDGVEQLTRYLELLNRDPLLSPVDRDLRRSGDQAAGTRPRRRPRDLLRHRRLRRPARHGRSHGALVLARACLESTRHWSSAGGWNLATDRGRVTSGCAWRTAPCTLDVT